MLNRAVFFSAYHNSVNDSLCQDFGDAGCTIYMPDCNWGKIEFFAPNQPYAAKYPWIKLVSYEEFLKLDPMIIFPPCVQHFEIFKEFAKDRGEVDAMLYLTATQDAIAFDEDMADFLLSHDIGFHRKSKAKYKMLYFNRPRIDIPMVKDIHKCYEEKEVNCFINNFGREKEFYQPGNADTLEDNRKLKAAMNGHLYGYNSEDGWLQDRDDVHKAIIESYAVSGIKSWETFGQTIMESMLMWTPTVHLKKFTTNILKYYGVTEDSAILCDTVEEAIAKLKGMSFSEYENLCWQARSTALQLTNKEARIEQLNFLLDRIIESK